MSPMATAVASTVVEIGGAHDCYASPKVVVSALLEALWSLYSNTGAMSSVTQSVQAEPMSPRA